MPRRSVADLVARFAELEDDAYSFARGYRTVRWSYRRLGDAARRFAAELDARSIQRGERMVLWGDNCGEWVAAFFGCALRGVVAVPLDRASTAEFVLRVAADVEARLVVCSQALTGHVRQFPAIALEELEAVVAARAPIVEPVALDRDEPLEIIFTSGTTGQPKGVVLTHGNVLANLEPLEREIAKYRRYERIFHPLNFLDLLPLSHVFGQFLGLFVPQALGACVHFHDSLNPAEVIHLIARDRINVCIAVPRMLESLQAHIEREYQSRGALEGFQRKMASMEGVHFARRWWRMRELHSMFGWQFWAFISGGSALGAETENFWSRAAFAVIQGYGMTETTSLVSVNHPFHRGKHSIGKTLAGREVKLAEDGEILVRGDNISRRYWQQGGLQEAASDDGWLHTGDLGERDEQGNLYFKGRKKNLIVTPAGMNVHPEDLEAVLKEQPGVRDAVVVGLPVGGNAEPCAVLLLKSGARAEKVVAEANRGLAEFQRMRQWRTWPGEDFPRTPTGKPRILDIERFAREQSDPAAQAPVEDLFERITRGEAHPGDLLLSSLDKVELMSALESRYQVDLSETRFAEAESVHDIQKLLADSAGSSARYEYPEWQQRWPFPWIRTVVYATLAWPATLLLAKPKVVGREHLRDLHGPALVVCNHVTQNDIGFILWALPWRYRRLATAMRAELLREMRHPDPTLPIWTRLWLPVQYALIVALFNVFPLPQRSGFTRSFAFAGESMDRGYSVLVFPEGRRTQDGQLSPFQAGVGILADRLHVPIIPMRIDGLFEAAKAEKTFVGPDRITVRIGPPVRYGERENPSSIAKDLERRVREL